MKSALVDYEAHVMLINVSVGVQLLLIKNGLTVFGFISEIIEGYDESMRTDANRSAVNWITGTMKGRWNEFETSWLCSYPEPENENFY